MNKIIVNILFFILCFGSVFAQSYKKDSLQIKVYTYSDFVDSKLKNIKASKVFCDFCSKSQLKIIKKSAIKESYRRLKNPDNQLENGQKRLVLYIRVAKKKLEAIKERELKISN